MEIHSLSSVHVNEHLAGVDFPKNRLNVCLSVSGYRPGGTGLTGANRGGIITSETVSGARNPYSKKAEKHAISYYDSVRAMKNDVETISQNTGLKESAIREIKNYIFFDEHDIGNGQFERFAPDYMMAESWKRLIDGKQKPHDITLLKQRQLCGIRLSLIISKKRLQIAGVIFMLKVFTNCDIRLL